MIIPRFLRRLFRAPFDGLRRLATVEEGRLYRSGQPRPHELAQLIARLGLRTVISLRGTRSDDDPDGWERAEREVCAAAGVEFVSIPCNHKNPPTPEQVERFLSLMRDPQRAPALVHCRAGQQRTGLFCALYRVHVQGRTPDEALREMDELGFGSGVRRHRRLLASFHQQTIARNDDGAAARSAT